MDDGLGQKWPEFKNPRRSIKQATVKHIQENFQHFYFQSNPNPTEYDDDDDTNDTLTVILCSSAQPPHCCRTNK